MRPLYDKKSGLSMLLMRLECIITSLAAGASSSLYRPARESRLQLTGRLLFVCTKPKRCRWRPLAL